MSAAPGPVGAVPPCQTWVQPIPFKCCRTMPNLTNLVLFYPQGNGSSNSSMQLCGPLPANVETFNGSARLPANMTLPACAMLPRSLAGCSAHLSAAGSCCAWEQAGTQLQGRPCWTLPAASKPSPTVHRPPNGQAGQRAQLVRARVQRVPRPRLHLPCKDELGAGIPCVWPGVACPPSGQAYALNLSRLGISGEPRWRWAAEQGATAAEPCCGACRLPQAWVGHNLAQRHRPGPGRQQPDRLDSHGCACAPTRPPLLLSWAWSTALARTSAGSPCCWSGLAQAERRAEWLRPSAWQSLVTLDLKQNARLATNLSTWPASSPLPSSLQLLDLSSCSVSGSLPQSLAGLRNLSLSGNPGIAGAQAGECCTAPARL